MYFKVFIVLVYLCFVVSCEEVSNEESEEDTEDLVDANQNTTNARFATYCTTPNEDKGLCLEVARCPNFAKLDITITHPSYDFFKASNCTARNAKTLKVCCGAKDNFDYQIPKQQQTAAPPTLKDDFGILPSDCGRQKLLSFSGRILGGKNASIGEFPWMGRLIHRDKQGGRAYGCSAFLIHKSFALTAAHCLNAKLLRIIGPIFQIVLGDHDSSVEVDCADRARHKCAPAPQLIRVGKPIVYSGYNTSTGNHNNDLALIQLKSPAAFTDFVRPICLMDKQSPINLFTVSGWGKTETMEESNIKKKIDLDRFPMDKCVDVYRKRGVSLKKKNQLCAGGLKNKDTCTGDSGGPLMVDDNNIWYAEGIVSFGIGCGQEGVPGVYTNIPTYLTWIKNSIEKKLTTARNKVLRKKKLIKI